ncbi:MAG TPA: hypothetical protein VFP27_14460, partial [Mycobacterium sp.]|nr:hypothetical protein [Mycobacterium sp.]
MTAAVGRQRQLGMVSEDHGCRLGRFQGVAHPGQLRFQRAAALAEQVTPWCRETDDRRRVVHLDAA